VKRRYPAWGTHLHSGEHRPSPGSPQAVQDEIERSLRASPLMTGRKTSARLGYSLGLGGKGVGGANYTRHPITLPKIGK
jgi:hypothetical protein